VTLLIALACLVTISALTFTHLNGGRHDPIGSHCSGTLKSPSTL
jgi:hypothetical protein